MQNIYDTLASAHHNILDKVKNDSDGWTLLYCACIPVYGPYLLSCRIDDIHTKFQTANFAGRTTLIEDYSDTAYIFLGAVAIQTLFFSIIPTIILASGLFMTASQIAIGCGLIIYNLHIDNRLTAYRNLNKIKNDCEITNKQGVS